ncbi:MAG: serine hydrolase [Proteobacteria bacterium]|nr:MAG: serine hydrolase [Pseudomonadota bacterium]
MTIMNANQSVAKTCKPLASYVLCLLGLLISLSAFAKTDINRTAEAPLTEYGQALAEHNRMLGTWALYQGDVPIFKQTWVPPKKNSDKDGDKDGTGISLQQSQSVSQYKIGSISKTFTAVLTFKMIEAGKLSLNTPLAQFYPKVANAKDITIGHMLTHHSGIASYTDSADFMTYYQSPQTPEQMVARIEALPAAFKPGEKGVYSNSNFLLLGYILEQISGQNYADLLKQHIVEPLNLKHTYYGMDDNNSDTVSYQWHNAQNQWQAIDPWSLSVAGAAGAIISSSDDLQLFFRGLFNDKLLSKDSLKQMTTLTDGFGYGIFQTKAKNNDHEVIGYWHNGGIEGFASHAIYFPEIEVTTVVLSNGLNKTGMDDLNSALIDAYFGHSLDNKLAALEVKAEQLKPYTGYFQSDTSPLDIEVMLMDDQLLAQATGQGAFPLSPDGEHRFTFQPANIEMLFKADMNSFTLNQGDNHNVYQRNDDAKPQAAEVDEALLQSYTGVYASEGFPLDITVSLKGGQLQAQATGQGAFPLTAKSETEFTFAAANITMVFNADNQTMSFTQMGRSFEMKKKE